jgi:phosphoglucomutase
VKSADGSDEVTVEVISSTEDHEKLLKTVFYFSAIKARLDRPDFSMVYAQCQWTIHQERLASVNTDALKPLVTVEDVVKKHWSKYGRNYYCRWDFEGVDKLSAEAMVTKMDADNESNTGKTVGKYTIATADNFTYFDPVNGSVTTKKGVRFLMADGSRIIFRLSGTAGSGATVRMYIEQYEPENIDQVASEALAGLVRIALDLCDFNGFIGTEKPTVIT